MKPGWVDTLRGATAHWPAMAIGLGLLGGIALSAAFLAGQRQAFGDAAGEAARCRDLAQQIMDVRGAAPAPAKISATAGQPVANANEGSAKIGSAADAAGIAAESIDRIEHDDAQRVGSSPYVRRQTEISLRGLPLDRVVDFIDELQSGRAPLVAQSLNVSPANGTPQQGDELWDVVLSVATVRYEQASPRGSMAGNDQ
jgi:hypothetical protein